MGRFGGIGRAGFPQALGKSGDFLRLRHDQGDEPQLGVGAVQQRELVQVDAVQVGQVRARAGRRDQCVRFAGWGKWR